MSAHPLHHELVTADGAEPLKWLAVLHGIFGSGKNWAPVARKVVERRPQWGVALVDLREHGRSTGMDGPFTLAQCAADITRLAEAESLRIEAVMGHSFGGKVALAYAQSGPANLRTVFVVDSSLESLPEPRGDGWMMLTLLRRLPADFATRDEAIGALTSFGISMGVAQWMAMNLERRGERYAWRMNLDHIEALLRDYYAADFRGVIERPPEAVTLHIVKATGSDHIPEELAHWIERIGSSGGGRVQLHRAAGGHWLNVDNPQAMIELLVSGLP